MLKCKLPQKALIMISLSIPIHPLPTRAIRKPQSASYISFYPAHHGVTSSFHRYLPNHNRLHNQSFNNPSTPANPRRTIETDRPYESHQAQRRLFSRRTKIVRNRSPLVILGRPWIQVMTTNGGYRLLVQWEIRSAPSLHLLNFLWLRVDLDSL